MYGIVVGVLVLIIVALFLYFYTKPKDDEYDSDKYIWHDNKE